MNPGYPTKQERESLLERLKAVSLRTAAGVSLLAVVTLAPRCGGAPGHYEYFHEDLKKTVDGRDETKADAPTTLLDSRSEQDASKPDDANDAAAADGTGDTATPTDSKTPDTAEEIR